MLLKQRRLQAQALTLLPPSNILTIIKNLDNAGLRRLGFGLLIESSHRHGWAKERCEHLDEYCDDMDLWISEAAGLIEPPQSLDKH